MCVCLIYGYLPTRNCTRVLTPRSGNVVLAEMEGGMIDHNALSTSRLLLLSFLQSLMPQENHSIEWISAKNAGGTADMYTELWRLYTRRTELVILNIQYKRMNESYH